MTHPTIPPAVWFIAAGAAQHVFAPQRKTTRRSRITASVIAASAVWFGNRSLQEFTRQGTTFHPNKPGKATALIINGPNSVTRNPMYTGLAGLLLAHAVARRSVPALIPLAGFVAVLNTGQIPAEEDGLRETFGAEYEQYCQRVPRWVSPQTIPLLGTWLRNH
ncbi:methyltransferase family protein [Jonesia quinghaiensis]|uniref:methyltransferase family protein n=1 Tax=Jonesia quinghaiensis TaxID=262806 RepID=UPI000412C4D7|nr:isoprenylcysteine carboxylmethyltransferase family protein [Jonesia quinghaiensis]